MNSFSRLCQYQAWRRVMNSLSRSYEMCAMRGQAVARVSTTWVSLGWDRVGYMGLFDLGISRIESDRTSALVLI